MSSLKVMLLHIVSITYYPSDKNSLVQADGRDVAAPLLSRRSFTQGAIFAMSSYAMCEFENQATQSVNHKNLRIL